MIHHAYFTNRMEEIRVLNIAIVGCGYVADGHIEAWRKISDARIAAVCDLNEELAKNTINQWKIPTYYKSLPDLIAKEKVDVVDICTPPQTHAPLAVQAMQAGINVLIEKPMTMSAKDAEKIVDCQKNSNVKAGVIHNWLFEPPIIKASSAVEQGLIGEMLSAEIDILNTKAEPMAANANHWCHRFPGGRFSEMLAHPIYLLRHFLKGEITSVNVITSKLGEYPWMKSDELVADFKAGRRLGTTYISLNAPRDAIFLGLYGTRGILKLDIINGTINLFPERKTSRFNKVTDSLRQAGQLTKSTAQNVASIAFGRWLSGHDMCIKLFAQSIRNKDKPPVTVEEGLEVVKVLENMCQMIETSTHSA